ncbi:hypothetical protein EDC96DRAFT_496425 [Choanephora cucurbitarum]|nr:hypothetical protein EDC96DRAFT_496425 [Choanephora cucurbitarum]
MKCSLLVKFPFLIPNFSCGDSVEIQERKREILHLYFFFFSPFISFYITVRKMQPWADKTNGSSNKTSSLHLDNTLSNVHHTSQSQTQSTGFRTSDKGKEKQYGLFDDRAPMTEPSPLSSYFNHPSSPSLQFAAAHENTLDGSEVSAFLNTTNYSDAVHQDDLISDSIAYISHRHQMDTQQALSEKEKLQHHWTAELLAAEDIVAYLQTADYTEDIYGIPLLGQWIKEAQHEIQQGSENTKKAVDRLAMIRSHLVQKAQGNVELAAKNVFSMNNNDWSLTFLDSQF